MSSMLIEPPIHDTSGLPVKAAFPFPHHVGRWSDFDA